MGADIDIGPRSRHCVTRARDEIDNGWLQHTHFIRQIVFDQQAVIITIARIHEAIIDVCQRDPRHVDTGVAQHPVLDCAIKHVIFLHRRRCLYLDNAPAIRVGHQHIGPHQYTLVTECRLEDRKVGAALDELVRLVEHEPYSLVERDLDRAGHAVELLRNFADEMTRRPE